MPGRTGDIGHEKALQCQVCFHHCVLFSTYCGVRLAKSHAFSPREPASSLLKGSGELKAVHAGNSSKKFPKLSGASSHSPLQVNSTGWLGGTSAQNLSLAQLHGTIRPESFVHTNMSSRRVSASSCPVVIEVFRWLVLSARKVTLGVPATLAHVFKNVLRHI